MIVHLAHKVVIMMVHLTHKVVIMIVHLAHKVIIIIVHLTHKVVIMVISCFNFHSFQNMMNWNVFRVNASNHECLPRNTLQEHLSSPSVFCGVRATRSLVICVYFVDRYLSFCTFSFDDCVVCSSSIYGFWLPLWYLWCAKSNAVLSIIQFTEIYTK